MHTENFYVKGETTFQMYSKTNTNELTLGLLLVLLDHLM